MDVCFIKQQKWSKLLWLLTSWKGLQNWRYYDDRYSFSWSFKWNQSRQDLWEPWCLYYIYTKKWTWISSIILYVYPKIELFGAKQVEVAERENLADTISKWSADQQEGGKLVRGQEKRHAFNCWKHKHRSSQSHPSLAAKIQRTSQYKISRPVHW